MKNAMTESPAIIVNDVQFSWSKETSTAPFIHIPHWQIAQGERVFLQGASGTGKSTLLNLLSGVLLTDHGDITVLGQGLHALNNRARDQFRARHLGIIFQQFNLIPYLSVKDNILLSQTFSKTCQAAERLGELCEQLQLPLSLLEQAANQLSVGQQQRIAVARALYHKPNIIIADEPTSALDSHTRDEFIDLLLAQSQKTNSTVIFVSHDHSIAAHFDRIDNLADINHTVSRGQ
jgi:putative ABC transport system ATP-binding protein